MIEAERISRALRLKYNKKFKDRIIIVLEGDKTWKGKILDTIDHETFLVDRKMGPKNYEYNVDIYDIVRVI